MYNSEGSELWMHTSFCSLVVPVHCQWDVPRLCKPVPLHLMVARLQPLGVPFLEGVLQYEGGLSVIGGSRLVGARMLAPRAENGVHERGSELF